VGEPFLNVPKELGPYVWTTLNVRLATIKEEPETVRKFVKAVIRGLKFTQENREEVARIAKKEFPTMSEEDLKATLDRSYADEAWSIDGTVSQQSWDTASKIDLGAGILKRPVPYDDVVDMEFVRALNPASGR
jgi:NitT/TauT family transport system substrate-binding protein